MKHQIGCKVNRKANGPRTNKLPKRLLTIWEERHQCIKWSGPQMTEKLHLLKQLTLTF